MQQCQEKDRSITVFAGLIDGDYIGPIKLIIFNYGNQDFVVDQRMRIAQLLIQKIVDPLMIEVAILDEMGRGKKEFGSTGI